LTKTLKQKKVSELEHYYNIAYVITRDKNITIEIDNNLPTAHYDTKLNHIVLTNKLFPSDFEKDYPKKHERVNDGVVSHESAHSIITLPYYDKYKFWIEQKTSSQLAKFVTNLIEDKRVNDFVETRYRFDYGKRLKEFRTLLKDTYKFEKFEDPDLFFGLLIMKGLYDYQIDDKDILQQLKTKFPHVPINEEDEKAFLNSLQKINLDIQKCLGVIEDSKYHILFKDLKEDCDKIYEVCQKYTYSQGNIPQFNNGKKPIELNEKLKEEYKNEEKEQEPNKNKSRFAGKGKGLNIPTPQPNKLEYERLVRRNQKEITELQTLLKRIASPILKLEQYQKHGRLMSKIIAKAYSTSLKRRVENIYEFKTQQYEAKKINLGVIIDYSGSMSHAECQDFTTILNEVFGNWLTYSSYGLYIFASDYQRIKTPYEDFKTTKYRVGGIKLTGGTMLNNCLKEVWKILGSISNELTKIIIIVSDFYLGDYEQVKETCKSINERGIKIINLVTVGNMIKAKELSEYSIQTNKEDLPKRLIELYVACTR